MCMGGAPSMPPAEPMPPPPPIIPAPTPPTPQIGGRSTRQQVAAKAQGKRALRIDLGGADLSGLNVPS